MKFWQHLLSKLQDSQKVYLLTVIQNSGSSPGRKGFKMLVAEDGFIFGSIGGGVMEFLLVEEAKKLLKESESKTLFKKQVHRKQEIDGSGMICSGEQTVVFHPLHTAHISMVDQLLNCLKSNAKGILILTPSSISFSNEMLEQNFDIEINSDSNWKYQEQIGFKSTLYLVGGGHVSVAVSDLFVRLGFHVIVFDDRENLNTLEQNNSAHQKMIVDFKEIRNYISEGPESYVAIMTNRYVDDLLVLTKLIENSFAYIGVLGSAAKLKTLWAAMQKAGIPNTNLDKVHGPIGIPIKSQTPLEIAVSIAAEVIRVRNVEK
jgi:xanthine dehydrogenase accessory factor